MAIVQPRIWGTQDIAINLQGVDRDSVTMSPNGGYVVTWRQDERIAFQMYNGNGEKLGGTKLVGPPINPDDTKGQQFADIVAYEANGSFVISWTESNQATGRTLRSQLFNFDGTSPDNNTVTNVSTTAKDDGAQLASNGQGWATAYVNSNNHVMIVGANPSGAAAPIQVTDSPITGVTRPDVAWRGDDSYVVSYTDGAKSYVRVLGSFGLSSVVPLANAVMASVATLKNPDGSPNGDFVVVWDNGSGPTSTVTAQRFHVTATGTITLVNSAVTVSTGAVGSDGIARGRDSRYDRESVTGLKDGGYAFAYVSRTGDDAADIYIKVVDATGTVGNAIKVSTQIGRLDAQLAPTIFEMADGRLAVSWWNPSAANGGSTIETTIVDARAEKVTITNGTTHDDIYAPSIHTGDNFNGGEGFDTLTFKESTAGVSVSLKDEKGLAGDALEDTYTEFERVIGTRFNDTLVGSAVANKLEGGVGDDTLTDVAGTGQDTLVGGTGNDTYYVSATNTVIDESGGGYDQVFSSATYTLSAGIENLYGTGDAAIDLTGNGSGNIIGGNGAANRITGLAGDDALYGNGGNDTLDAGDGNDALDGGAGDDTLVGGAGNDTLFGRDGNDTLNGDDGNDVLDGGNGNDAMNGGNGADALSGGDGIDNLDGGAGDDALNGNGDADVMNGGDGNDVLDGGDGNDAMNGGAGTDNLQGGDGNDTLDGGNDNDIVNGGAGNDSMVGGGGDDVINGGTGADTMDGGAGNDSYVIDDANDVVNDTGGGMDSVTVTVAYDLNRLKGIENITGIGTLDFTFTGTADSNVMNGSDGINIFDGAAGNDSLNGNGGNDTLRGGDGNDVLSGGAGNDRLHGGLGADVLDGGSQADIFVFDTNPKTKGNADRIVNYAKEDAIYIDDKYFKVGPKGSLAKPKAMASKSFYAGTKAHDADDRIIYNKKTGGLYYDSDGTGSQKAVLFATITNKLKIDYHEFFVI
ncbi:calcium-binding protein [Microvirga sesbaniae]|uniref:calcium-binding protein n=1 Tax=Microvirga sesbaniae TaxID=681392 RepID=UPI0021C8746D|nr:calcium-binding protein [Microvirga sp. HBU67692]